MVYYLPCTPNNRHFVRGVFFVDGPYSDFAERVASRDFFRVSFATCHSSRDGKKNWHVALGPCYAVRMLQGSLSAIDVLRNNARTNLQLVSSWTKTGPYTILGQFGSEWAAFLLVNPILPPSKSWHVGLHVSNVAQAIGPSLRHLSLSFPKMVHFYFFQWKCPTKNYVCYNI